MKEALCRCGHLQSAHLYEEGQCLPGFECEAKCEEFRPKPISLWMLDHLVMPKHKMPDYPLSDCSADRITGYVHEIDSTHWHCNRCGAVVEVPEEK